MKNSCRLFLMVLAVVHFIGLCLVRNKLLFFKDWFVPNTNAVKKFLKQLGLESDI